MALGKIGKYEKLDILGHGVSGIVYLAWDTLLGKHVALKEISLQAADEERFLEEARVLDRLRHPNIVQVNGVDRVDGRLVIDMEYVKGTNLHEYMRRCGKLPVREALSIAVQVCDALDFAHRNRTIHRDIKPANILISQEGRAKIGDFGLAEILGSGSYAGGAGTYAYMAPEDFDPEERSDHRSDIWAVGVTLYEMLTGRRPFQAAKAKDPFSWKRAVEEDEPVSLLEVDPSLPSGLEQVIARALAKNKHDRCQSAGELRGQLARVLESLGGPVRVGEPVGQVEPPCVESERVARDSGTGVMVWPPSLDFGRIRQGAASTENVTIRVPGRGRTKGRVASQPGWILVSPQAFDRRKQKLLVTADTESIWRPGLYSDSLVLEVDGEDISVTASVEVLPPRRQFYEVAWWYVPLFVFCLLPLVARWLSGGLVDPPALIATGLLSVMLFIISVVADLGILEKLFPMALGAVGVGAVVGALWRIVGEGSIARPGEVLAVSVVGTLLSLLVALQLLTASKWRFWAVVLVISAFCVTIALA